MIVGEVDGLEPRGPILADQRPTPGTRAAVICAEAPQHRGQAAARLLPILLPRRRTITATCGRPRKIGPAHIPRWTLPDGLPTPTDQETSRAISGPLTPATPGLSRSLAGQCNRRSDGPKA